MVSSDLVKTPCANASTRNTKRPMTCLSVTVFDTPRVASELSWLPQVTAVWLRVSPQGFKQDSVRVRYETRKEVVVWATFEQWYKGLSQPYGEN